MCPVLSVHVTCAHRELIPIEGSSSLDSALEEYVQCALSAAGTF